jgi:hypothetical protein
MGIGKASPRNGDLPCFIIFGFIDFWTSALKYNKNYVENASNINNPFLTVP